MTSCTMENSLLDSYRYRLLAGFPLAGLGGAPSMPHRAVRAMLLCCPSVLYLNFSSLLGSHLNPSVQKVLWDLVSVSPASFLLPTPRLHAVTLKFIVLPPRTRRVSCGSASLFLLLPLSMILFFGLSAWKTPIHLSRCN